MALITRFTSAEKTTHNSHKFGFTLSPTNYGFWKTMIEPFLITNNLSGYVDGSIPCPSPTVETETSSSSGDKTKTSQPNPNYPIWIANDAHIRMLIISTISEAAFSHVQGTTTSRDLWLSPERAYAPHTAFREYTLKAQLLKIEMKGDETSSAYLTRAQGYLDALTNIGEPMKDKDIVMLVVSGLREEYNGFKSGVFGRQPPVQFSELSSLLADYEYLMKKPLPDIAPAQAFVATAASRNTTTATTASPDPLQALSNLLSQLGLQVQSPTGGLAQAFYTNRGGGNRGRGRGTNRSCGGYNNRTQGDSSNNRNLGGNHNTKFPWASNQNTVFGTCNRCGIGHIPSECPNRDPSTFRRPQPMANYADYRSQASTSLLPDTGTNFHVARDLSWCENSEPYHGDDNLHVGNGHFYPHYPPHGSK